MIGRTISHYRITEKLGEGGMGVVYRAEDLSLHRTVALKFLGPHALDDPEAKERFLREARAAASLDHPNVCTIYEIGEADGQTFLSMAYIEGQTVKEKIAERPLKLDEALAIALGAGEGLLAAHEKGIVHRDIKSANLMVTPEGTVKVMDFGLAQISGQSGLTKSSTTLGTATYMSPEQAQRLTLDHRSDIWSLGVVIYEMVTGKVPFGGEHEAAVLYAIIHTAPEPVTALRVGVPATLDRVIAKAMAKDAAGRYQHVDELLVDLRALQKGLPVSAPDRLRRRNVLIGAGALAAAAAGVAIGLKTGSHGFIKSLVVLPLENLSGDPEQEYFADGMTDALITDLSKVGSLRMISRKTAMRYKGSKKPLREIARELSVDAVVEGSVAREAGRVRVSAQLIDVATDRNLWAESYERDFTSILTLQGEVSRAIVGKIRVNLRPEEEARLVKNRKVNPETYEAYLRGMFWLNKGRGTEDSINKGIAYLKEALEKDPGDPYAYAGLAQGYVTIAHGPNRTGDDLSLARAAAERAVRLDDTLAEAHYVLAVIKFYDDWEWEAGQRIMDHALDLNPNLAEAHYHKSWFHALFGQMEEAIAEHKRAQELDPMTPQNTAWLGEIYRTAGRHQEAIAECRRAFDIDPKNPLGYLVLGFVYSDLGRHEEAIAEQKKAAEIAPRWKWLGGISYARAGRIEDTRKLLADLERLEVAPWNAFCRAVLNTWLGNKDEAFRWLDYKPPHMFVPAVRSTDWFKPLHGDPRFLALLKRMNLPPP